MWAAWLPTPCSTAGLRLRGGLRRRSTQRRWATDPQADDNDEGAADLLLRRLPEKLHVPRELTCGKA